ncbi:MAG: hypothetical protein KC684_02690 [Candidatus Omnitrophica bacterium]|nr:hypothetical protein [Candidatus Omnitrophota bacterium]
MKVNPIKILSALGIGFGFYWIPKIIFTFQPESYDASSFLEFIGMLFPILLMTIPGFMGFWFGWQCLKKLTVKSIKGLIASYCIVIVGFCGSLFFNEQEINTESIFLEYLMFLLVVLAVAGYVILYRYFLKANNFTVPPIKESLPTSTIAFISFFLFSILNGIIKLPDGSKMKEEPINFFVTLFLPFIIAGLTFIIGKRLFANGKT